ncbi:LysM domain-containing protein [Microbacterium sp. NPDC089189]|uniref:LysM peptidoglycan-binding domain-containing protein n=1 Tax=Microbacterium sp. NPDC089189 TaxID=3154972 RepID=UPI003429139E
MTTHAFARPHAAALGFSALAGSVALSLVSAPAPAHADAGGAPRTQAAPRPATTPVPTTHVVAAGESVSAIADRYGLATADVLAWNGLSWASSTIHPGDVLQVAAPAAAEPTPAPTAPAPAASVVVVAGDTVSALAARHGTTTPALLAANGLTWDSIIYPGQTLVLPGGAPASAPAPAPAPAAVAPAPPAAPAIELDAEQQANARVIIAVGRQLGVSDRGIAIALGTAMQESWLRNLDWGDRDSQGLFQQRPSTGWGSIEQVRDPDRSTRAFFGGPGDPNGTATRGLLDIAGWEGMSFADAAQAVQISAYPDRYARWEQPATTWLAVLG